MHMTRTVQTTEPLFTPTRALLILFFGVVTAVLMFFGTLPAGCVTGCPPLMTGWVGAANWVSFVAMLTTVCLTGFSTEMPVRSWVATVLRLLGPTVPTGMGVWLLVFSGREVGPYPIIFPVFGLIMIGAALVANPITGHHMLGRPGTITVRY